MPYSVATPGDSSVLSLYCRGGLNFEQGGGIEGKKKRVREEEEEEEQDESEKKSLAVLRETKTKGKKKAILLTALILPPYSAASSSIRGAIMRHGPHQGAQKSMRTGTGDLRTFSSHVASVTGPEKIGIGKRERERRERERERERKQASEARTGRRFFFRSFFLSAEKIKKKHTRLRCLSVHALE